MNRRRNRKLSTGVYSKESDLNKLYKSYELKYTNDTQRLTLLYLTTNQLGAAIVPIQGKQS